MNLTVKTLSGLETLLEQELKDLGAKNIESISRGFTCSGDEELMYKINYQSRFSVKVLQELYSFSFKTKEDYLEQIKKYEWDFFIKPEESIAVDAVVFGCDLFDNSLYTAQLTKDGMVDFFRNRYGLRPSVRTNFPELRVSVFISGYNCTVYADTSGSSLHKRGYRKSFHAAPVNEVLAAGLVALSGWKFDCDFYDPMCGSGTIVIEAAMAAMNIPAGYFREDFGFKRWQNFKPRILKRVKDSADAEIKEFDHKIIGSDYSDQVIRSAWKNIFSAGLKHDVQLLRHNVFTTEIPKGSMVVFNPPYDERLSLNDATGFYKKLGDTIKNNMRGCKVWMLVGNPDLWKSVGLKTSAKIPLFNGNIESRFLGYESYEGTKKFNKAENYQNKSGGDNHDSKEHKDYKFRNDRPDRKRFPEGKNKKL